MGREFWTPAEVRRLIEARAAGLQWSAIAERVGRNVECCKRKLSNLPQHMRPVRLRHKTKLPGIGRAVPNAAVLNLEHRLAARARQSLTGQVLGDPPPGFSALDRRGYR